MKKTLFFVMLLLLAACKKNQNNTDYQMGPLYSIPVEIKAWTMFKPGSYWIYKNEASAALDSSGYKYGPYFEATPCLNCPVIQHMWYFLNSNEFVKFELYGEADSGNVSLGVITSKYEHFRILTAHTITHPDSSSNSNDYLQSYKCLGVFNKLVINGNSFYNVIGTRDREYYYDESYEYFMESYFVRNIGLVKFRKFTKDGDSTWTLVRWHIVQ